LFDGGNARDLPLGESSRPILVLMPGLDGTGLLFTEFVRLVSPQVQCIVIAYPKDQPMGYDELEGIVLAALPKQQSFVLLGESFSGPLAIRIAARKPSGLVGLILCVTFAKNPYPRLAWARPLAAYLPVKSLPRWVRAPLMWGSASPKRAPTRMARAMSGVSSAVIRRRIAALLTVDETVALGRLKIPTLVLRAIHDRVISKRATQAILEALPSAKQVDVEGPHLLLRTQPSRCAEIILGFLSELGTNAGIECGRALGAEERSTYV
jgi:pimeloyl-ACP methyl ester carboxylesterase